MNLATNYLGKCFENPFVLASGPPTASADMISRAFEAGWAGAVIKAIIPEAGPERLKVPRAFFEVQPIFEWF